MESMNNEELYGHYLKLNTDLFQTYFAMSRGIATEINYLEQKEEEID